MAHIVRSPKSGESWTTDDLSSYNIVLEVQDPLTFFGVQELPQPQAVPHELLTALKVDEATDANIRRFLKEMNYMRPGPGYVGMVTGFMINLLLILDYTDGDRMAFTRTPFDFLICGQKRAALFDLCIEERVKWDVMLVVRVQDDGKEHIKGFYGSSVPSLIADAIVVFTTNNEIRVQRGEDALESMIIPGIMVLGTTPTFYKIPITQDLAKHVAEGTYPPDRTVVTYCPPPFTKAPRTPFSGMTRLADRGIVLSCYEAFKKAILEN